MPCAIWRTSHRRRGRHRRGPQPRRDPEDADARRLQGLRALGHVARGAHRGGLRNAQGHAARGRDGHPVTVGYHRPGLLTGNRERLGRSSRSAALRRRVLGGAIARLTFLAPAPPVENDDDRTTIRMPKSMPKALAILILLEHQACTTNAIQKRCPSASVPKRVADS